IPNVKARTDSKGRKQPSAKPRRKSEKSFRRRLIEAASNQTDITPPGQLSNKVPKDAIAAGNLETTPDPVDQCVDSVREVIERAISELRRDHAPQEIAHLFAALGEAIADLQRKTLRPTMAAAEPVAPFVADGR